MNDESQPEHEPPDAGQLTPANFHVLFGDLHRLLGIWPIEAAERDAARVEGTTIGTAAQ